MGGLYTGKRPASESIGLRFDRLVITATERVGSYSMANFSCDCGKTGKAQLSDIKSGKVRSCGCLQAELLAERNRRNAKHRRCRTPEHYVWSGMIQRCTNPNDAAFENYGGRGIKVCDRWRDFESFLADMGERPSSTHSLDRIDNNGNYEPGNCRWATQETQSRNRRSNRMVTIGGLTHCVADWADFAGLAPGTIYGRLHSGWTGHSLLRPVQQNTRRSKTKG